MGKKVICINGDEARVVVGPSVKDEGWEPSRRAGKGHGTGKTNRQSSQDKPVRHRP